MTEREIFIAALHQPDPADRAAFLDRACAGEAALRERVAALVDEHERLGDFLETPDPVVAAAREQSCEAPGTVIGPYKLVEQIGEGGMGLVFLAEQSQPVRRLVALKVLKPGLDTRHVLARFDAERQALALMDHPHIAQVYDAGTAPSGRPYFVMELVRGVPITDFCDQHRLDPRRRLALFADVCRAVQHAHQKGIIHRDLKPSNVLVTLHDTVPVPKVIDFGIAKATGERLTERTLVTNFAQVIGTPLYMSPEQAEMNGLDVDTRSDVYSLGVLLYELLTGTTPFDPARLREVGCEEVLRILREEEPPRPSQQVGAMTAAARSTVSVRRGVDARRYAGLLRGDLDWVVMKALEKDRNRRYDSASGFARDVERFLADEPVQARPPSQWYRIQKFARRNKAALATAVAVAAALLVGIGVATWQALQATRAESKALAEKTRADQEATTAKRVTESFQQMLGLIDPDAASRSMMSLSAIRLQVVLGLVRPDANRGLNYTVQQMIDDFADNIEGKLADRPAAAAELLATIGRAYACRGQREKARKHLDRALVLGRSVFGEQHENYADLLVDYSRPDASSGLAELQTHEADLRRALAIYRSRGVGGEQVIRALWVLQWNLGDQGHVGAPEKWDEIEPVVNEGLAEAAKTPDVEFAKTASLTSALARVRIRQSQFAEAERIARQAVAMHQKSHPDSLETAWGYSTLSDALKRQGKLAEALAGEKQALNMMRNILPPEHVNIAVLSNAAIGTVATGFKNHTLLSLFPSVADLGELESVFRQMASASKASKLNNSDPAYVAVRSLVRLREFYLELGRELAAAGNSDEAEQARKRATQLLDSLQTQLAGNAELLPFVYSLGAIALIKSGEAQQANELGRKLDERVAPTTSQAMNLLAWFLANADEPAHRNPTRAVELAKALVEANPQSSYYRNTLGVARYRAGDWALAIPELEKSLALGSPNSIDYFFLAMAHWKLGQVEVARERSEQGVQWMDKHQPNNEQLRRYRTEVEDLMRSATGDRKPG